MNPESASELERCVGLAETEADLNKVRAHVDEAEAELFFRAMDLANAPVGPDEAHALRSASERLLTVKRDRLDWRPSESR
jgi:hypothetical protein